MKKMLLVVFSLLLFFFLMLYFTKENPKNEMKEVYTVAFESLMKEDTALNDGIVWIAIDMDNLTYVSEAEKKKIMNHLEKIYEVPVVNINYSEMKKQGLFDAKTHSLKGVFLQIENTEFTWNRSVVIESSKRKSAKGGIGVSITIHHKHDEWSLKKMTPLWIS